MLQKNNMTLKETIGVVVVAFVACVAIFWIALINDKDDNSDFVKNLPATASLVDDAPTTAGGVDDHEIEGVSWYMHDGVYDVTYGQFGFQLAMSEPRPTEYLGEAGTAVDLTFTESRPTIAGKLMATTDKVTKLTRLYFNDPLWFDPTLQEVFEIDEARTSYDTNISGTTFDSDPLREKFEFSGNGVYFWVYGGLYYYDPETGNIGLNLTNSP